MTVHDVLAALDTLEDGELHVVMTRAQALLLDHPGPTGGGSALAVEIVERQEGRLLAAYRALAPGVQRRLLEQVTRLGRTWPVHRQSSPGGPAAASRTSSTAMMPRRLLLARSRTASLSRRSGRESL